MTIHWLICPYCGHKQGCRVEPIGTIACVACSKPMTRKGWAAADADDLSIYYTRNDAGLVATEAGKAKGYC